MHTARNASITFSDLVYFSNVVWSALSEKFEEQVGIMATSAKFTDIRYSTPIPKSDEQCFRKNGLLTCEKSPEDIYTLDWLFEACAQFYNPVYTPSVVTRPFMNIFCVFCRQ